MVNAAVRDELERLQEENAEKKVEVVTLMKTTKIFAFHFL